MVRHLLIRKEPASLPAGRVSEPEFPKPILVMSRAARTIFHSLLESKCVSTVRGRRPAGGNESCT